MAEQQHDQQEHPPEKKCTSRRAIVGTKKENKSAWSFLRRGQGRGQGQSEKQGEPVQDHVSCYANLSWEVLHGYLDSIFPGWEFRESKVTFISAC